MQGAQGVGAVQLDGYTADGTAGIRAEFESLIFYFISRGCSLKDANVEKTDHCTAYGDELGVDGRLDSRSRKAQCRVHFR